MNDERLRQQLREGDPAMGEGGLTPDEVRTMRRTVLTAAPEPRRRLLPILALAGAAAAAVLIAILTLRLGPEASSTPPRIATIPKAIPKAAPREPEGTLQPPVLTGEQLQLQDTEPQRVRHRRHRRPVAPKAPEVNDTLAVLEPPTRQETTSIREIQFSTPGGTRILWTLAPGKTSY